MGETVNASTGGGPPRGSRVRRQNGIYSGQNIIHPSTSRTTTSRQSRAGKWRSSGGRYLQRVRSRLRAFRTGTRKSLRQISPAEILASGREYEVIDHGLPTPEPLDPVGLQTLSEEQRAISACLTTIREGSSGFVPDKKPLDVVRLFGENVNSLSLYDDNKSWKIKNLRAIASRYQVDGSMLVECGTDFWQVPESKSLSSLLGDTHCKVITANNTTEPSGRSQYGGVASIAYPRLAGFVTESKSDPSGLGRWSWLYVGKGSRKTRIVTAYRPVTPSKKIRRDPEKGWYTVWGQHHRYLRKKGIVSTPRRKFAEDLIKQLLAWKESGDEIILFMDVNENVYYSGKFAKRLAERDLMMTEQFLGCNGVQSPTSYYRGSTPITGCFCTQGVDCLNVYTSPHRSGAGDHRYWIMDFDAKSVLGEGYPHLVRPRGRRLKNVVRRTQVKYLRRLRKLSDRHKMYDKMHRMIEGADTMSRSELAAAMNTWDREHTEHQLSAENHCNYFKNDFIEFSPETNLWIKRRDLYRQLLSINARRSHGKRAPITHFVRSCAANDIADPFSLSTTEIHRRIEACQTRLSELKSVAPLLRIEHLRRRLADAKERGDKKAAMRIKMIMRNEKLRKRWQGVHKSTKPRNGGAPTSIKVQHPDGDQRYDTQSEVEEHAARKLTSRFKLARDAPICEGKIFDDVGYLGDNASTRAILEGTYEFPPDMDPHLRLLLEEAHSVFSQKSTEEISTYVKTDDFQYYWKHADEFVQSSYSNVHFGHYKAIAQDQYLSALQAAKLSLSTKTGIPMERWGSALTVLLEKEFGNIYIEKMRAICLLEADFNWLNKLIFAKRMMDQAYDNGMVPVEQFARRGTQASNGVLCKVLFCDMMRALHEMAGVASVDLGNCYDAVAHPLASIALQAFMVPVTSVVLMLTVLQSMTFHLRTGYGVSQEGYGGSPEDPTFGLGQGNGAAPPGFTTVSALMDNAYKRLGHAATFCGSWSDGILFCLAAILYVDDTDLLLVSKSRMQTEMDFFHQAQHAITDWGKITLATGGYLKATKCFWYLMSWEWKNGVPTLRTRRQQPNFQMTIPQKSGTPVSIPLRDVSHVEETLGVWSCPLGDFGVHIGKKMEVGHLWAERLRRNRCPAADGWLGFRYSLIPKCTYGFAAITPDPDFLEESFQRLYRDVLSPLRVNMNIKKFYRMAPKRVQGLGMPNPGIVMLGQKLHLLQSEWGQQTATGQMLRQSLEVFQMECGLSGNIFDQDYSRLSSLATDGWWKQFWCLCSRYKVNFLLDVKFHIPLLRVGDRAIMDIVTATDVFSAVEWAIINRVRRFLGLHSLTDLCLCDGRTVDPVVLSCTPSTSSRLFSIERPTKKDFALFQTALRLLLTPNGYLPTTLGQFVNQPHRADNWFVNEASNILYYATGNCSYTRYTLDTTYPTTRHGSRFHNPVAVSGLCPRRIRASVLPGSSSDSFILHSTAPVFVPSKPRRSFLQRLQALPNQSLWSTLQLDGDGSWIYEGLLRNSLVMMSDGSYNEAVARDVCSCAAVIQCSTTGHRASVTWVEKSDNYTADNYRAEILGGIALQLLLSVAVDGKYISPSMRPIIGCDNSGVVLHGNTPYRPLPSQQGQADVLRYYKQLIRQQPFKCKMVHVHGHLDELLDLADLSPLELANVFCDYMASASLSEAAATQTFIERVLPNEEIVVEIGGDKICGAYTPIITRSWGDEIAREHYHDQGIVHRDDYDLVYWDGMEKVMKGASEMWSVWVTKQVSGFCGVNHVLRHFQPGVVDVCPNCGVSPEPSSHIYSCRDEGRSDLFQQSVDKISSWMAAQRTDPELMNILSVYLRSRGERSMLSCCSSTSRYRQLAIIQDRLGFRNMLEGRIPCLLYNVRADYIKERGLRKHPGHWCNGLITRLLQITHRQWTYRNGTVHLRGPDGLTLSQQRALAQKCEDLLWTDPSDLLEADRALLDMDFSRLGSGPATDRQMWVSEMEAARAASQHTLDVTADTAPPRTDPPVDSEGSIRYRRRKRRSKGH